jgi:hypothetical protein
MIPVISQAKLDANRANAQKSTGPKTDAGKAKVSQNATRHGLASHGLIVAPEDLPYFTQIESELRADAQPAGALEETAFQHLLMHRWNIIRVQKAEAVLMSGAAAQGHDPLLHPETAKQAELYLRYCQRFESAYRSAYRHLQKLQTERAVRMNLVLECSPDLPKNAEVEKIQQVAEQTQRLDWAPIREEMMLSNLALKQTDTVLKQGRAHEKELLNFDPTQIKARHDALMALQFGQKKGKK